MIYLHAANLVLIKWLYMHSLHKCEVQICGFFGLFVSVFVCFVCLLCPFVVVVVVVVFFFTIILLTGG